MTKPLQGRKLRILLAFFVLHTVSICSLSPPALSIFTGRRAWLAQSVGSVLVAGTTNSRDELPDLLRGISLAPLGKPQVSDSKTLNLTLEELAARLTRDLTEGAHKEGGYFITGDLSTDIFRDDCIFSDPTNKVQSLSRYQNALRILFDPAVSQVQLLSPLEIDEQKRTISGRIRSRGYLQLPWRPFVSAYESDIVYTVDESGLIAGQDQTWDSKSSFKALRESFTPSLVDPPPKSTRRVPTSSESKEVTELFEYINGRRPNEYTSQERSEISSLIAAIVTDSNGKSDFNRDLLSGRWILAYLQPGPDGAGIDRRIPFPDFDFNDNFQVFDADAAKITNIGQVLGPLVDVKVSGTLQEVDELSTRIPKEFRASIHGGTLCFRQTNCIGLPIEGEGIFDSLYLGERLRIGQNINGGGARIVQIRLD
eukprot:scaffold184_cov125-Cylindrotheca_fusiformis.AAC.3